MLLDLTRYRRPVEHFARTFDPGEVGAEGEAYQVVAPVQLAVDVQKDKDRYRLTGTIETELELECGRCLEPFRLPVRAAVDVRFHPFSEVDTAVEREVSDDDLETSYYRDEQIDLNELLQEQFYLALPMKPLCREDCKGLCPVCGINRNTATCGCASNWEDPRLAPLKSLTTQRPN
jgi:uncharacterized protein